MKEIYIFVQPNKSHPANLLYLHILDAFIPICMPKSIWEENIIKYTFVKRSSQLAILFDKNTV